MLFALSCFLLNHVCADLRLSLIFGARERQGAGWDGEVCWMLAAGGCCALRFTSGVSGLCIHAVLRNDFIYVVDVVIDYVCIDFCVLIAV